MQSVARISGGSKAYVFGRWTGLRVSCLVLREACRAEPVCCRGARRWDRLEEDWEQEEAKHVNEGARI